MIGVNIYVYDKHLCWFSILDPGFNRCLSLYSKGLEHVNGLNVNVFNKGASHGGVINHTKIGTAFIFLASVVTCVCVCVFPCMCSFLVPIFILWHKRKGPYF